MLETAVTRGSRVMGGSCAFAGACGAASGAGVALSLLLKANPLTPTQRRQVWKYSPQLNKVDPRKGG